MWGAIMLHTRLGAWRQQGQVKAGMLQTWMSVYSTSSFSRRSRRRSARATRGESGRWRRDAPGHEHDGEGPR